VNSKERVLCVLSGREPDVVPVTPPYYESILSPFINHYYLEIYSQKMKNSCSYQMSYVEDVHIRATAINRAYAMLRQKPDWMPVHLCPSKEWLDSAQMVREESGYYQISKITGKKINISRGEDNPNLVDLWSTPSMTKETIKKLVPVTPVDILLQSGRFELAKYIVDNYGKTVFTFGYLSPPFTASYDIVGFEKMMTLPYDDPNLLRYLMHRLHDRDLEVAKAYAAVGVDAIFLEECFVSADLISPNLFDKFVFPMDHQFITEIKNLGLYVILEFCGDVIPRLNRIAKLGVDCLAVEESKKNFTVDICDVVSKIGDELCLIGNIDAIMLQHWTVSELEAEIKRQLRCGLKAKGFMMGIGSPLPPNTQLSKFEDFIALSRKHGRLTKR